MTALPDAIDPRRILPSIHIPWAQLGYGIASGTITVNDVLIEHGISNGLPVVKRADNSAIVTSRGRLYIAMEGTTDGLPVRFVPWLRVQAGLNTATSAIGNPVYLSTTGDISLASTPLSVQVGEVQSLHATEGWVLLAPNLDYAGAGGATNSTASTSYTINDDPAAAVNEDPYLALMGGDGGAEIIVSILRQDSSADLVHLWTALSTGVRRTTTFAIGDRTATENDLDAYLEFDGTTAAGAASQAQIRWLGDEARFDVMSPANFAGIRFDGTNVVTAVFDYSQLATGEADYILAANLASAVAWRVGATDIMSIDTTTSIPALDLDATLDIDHVETLGARVLADLLLQYNFATGDSVGMHVHNQQFTTARTGNNAYGLRVTMTSLVGDLNNPEYNNLDLLVVDGGAATATHNALNFGAGFNSIMDLSACATGEADVIMAANLASAMAWRVAAVDLMSLDTTTAVWAVDIDASMTVDYALAAAGNLLAANLTVSHATDAMVVAAFANVHNTARTGVAPTTIISATIDSDAADDGTVRYNALGLYTDGTDGVHTAVLVGGGFDALIDVSGAATGEADIVLGAALASAMSWRVAANPVLTIDTVAGEINSTYRLTTTDGVAAGDERIVGGRVYNRIADTATLDSGVGAVGPTAIDTYTVPANTIKAGTHIRFGALVFVSVGGGAVNLTIDAALGAQVIATNVAADPADDSYVYVTGEIIGTVAPAAVAAVIHEGSVTAATAVDASPANTYRRNAIANQATDGALALTIRGTWAAGAGESCLVRRFWVDIDG